MMYAQVDANAPSGGTTPLAWPLTPKEPNFIVITDVAMIDSVVLDASPVAIQHGQQQGARADVMASVERSLGEYADVWAELSKF